MVLGALVSPGDLVLLCHLVEGELLLSKDLRTESLVLG